MIQGGSSDSRHAPKRNGSRNVKSGIYHRGRDSSEYRHFKGAWLLRQGDEVNPEKRSSGNSLSGSGKTYTDQELDQIEKKMAGGEKSVGDRLFKPLREEFQRYKRQANIKSR